MRQWQLQEAKAKLSELLDTAAREGPQMVTRRGVEEAVVVPMAEWRRMRPLEKPTLKDLLLADSPRMDIPIPQRGRLKWRSFPDEK
jgi:prevent-host-death family protein